MSLNVRIFVKNTFLCFTRRSSVLSDGGQSILSCPACFYESGKQEDLYGIGSVYDAAIREQGEFSGSECNTQNELNSFLASPRTRKECEQRKSYDEKCSTATSDETASLYDWPSVGSRLHFEGQCSPCLFIHTTGCRQGKECTFCHLCDRKASKTSQRERLQEGRQKKLMRR